MLRGVGQLGVVGGTGLIAAVGVSGFGRPAWLATSASDHSSVESRPLSTWSIHRRCEGSVLDESCLQLVSESRSQGQSEVEVIPPVIPGGNLGGEDSPGAQEPPEAPRPQAETRDEEAEAWYDAASRDPGLDEAEDQALRYSSRLPRLRALLTPPEARALVAGDETLGGITEAQRSWWQGLEVKEKQAFVRQRAVDAKIARLANTAAWRSPGAFRGVDLDQHPMRGGVREEVGRQIGTAFLTYALLAVEASALSDDEGTTNVIDLPLTVRDPPEELKKPARALETALRNAAYMVMDGGSEEEARAFLMDQPVMRGIVYGVLRDQEPDWTAGIMSNLSGDTNDVMDPAFEDFRAAHPGLSEETARAEWNRLIEERFPLHVPGDPVTEHLPPAGWFPFPFGTPLERPDRTDPESRPRTEHAL